MKAMLFAAGKGTRLQPLTDTSPKCLVTAGNKTLLEHNLRFLKESGVKSVVINTHHLAQQVIDFVKKNDFGVEIHFSQEADLLETGGGLLQAKSHFQDEEAFVVCNSDIYTDFDLKAMINTHLTSERLATLAVADRKTSRYLRFDDKAMLCGWENRKTGERVSWTENDHTTRAFNGVQVLSPKIFDYMHDFAKAFSIIPVYLKAAEAGEHISAYEIGGAYWIDIGTIEKLEELREYLRDSK